MKQVGELEEVQLKDKQAQEKMVSEKTSMIASLEEQIAKLQAEKTT